MSPTVRDANLDAAALLPGLLAAASDHAGAILGIPVDFELLTLQYSAAVLQKAHLQPPPSSGWSIRQFRAAVGALASTGPSSTVFGDGLATYLGDFFGQVPAWFGFAEGYGGNVFGSRVVLASGAVYKGLQVYADILKVTWAGWMPGANPSAGLGFVERDATIATKPWSEEGLARFPRLPVPVAPANVNVASVPRSAPHPVAGAQFCVWLVSPHGQAALTSIGYPAVRSDAAGTTPEFAKAKIIVRPQDLRFRPGGIFGTAWSRGSIYRFDSRIVDALLQPEPVRLLRLRSIEDALTGVLNGSQTPAQGAAMLNRADVPPLS